MVDRSRRRRLIFGLPMLAVVLMSHVLTASSLWAFDVVKIGILVNRPKTQALEQWRPMAILLKQAIPERDFSVEVFTHADLEAVVASRQVDFVLTNAAHYVLLKQQSGLSSPLATLLNQVDGKVLKVFGGVIFSRHERTDLKQLIDLKGKMIATVGIEAFGGYQMQAYELSRVGIHLPQDAQLIFTGMPQDKVVEAVLSGNADVGFVRSGVIEAMVQEGRIPANQIKILNLQNLPGFPLQVSTRLYPEFFFAAMPHTDEDLARRVLAALFSMHGDHVLLRKMEIHGFTVPADYTPVEDLLKELRLRPFDVSPQFTMADVWERYHWQIVLTCLSILTLSLLGISLLLANRRLAAERRTVLTQQRDLRISEKRYHDLFHQANEGLIMMTTDGQLAEVNNAFAVMHGYRADEIDHSDIGKFDVMKEQTLPSRPDITSRIEGGEVVRFEVQHYHKDGHIFPVGVTSSKVRIADKEYYLASHQDLTAAKQAELERRSLEERLRRSEKLEALGQMAGGVAHDLNNVLGVLMGYTEILLEEIPEGHPLRKYVDSIYSSSERGAAIISDLLTLARRGITVSETVNLNRLVSEFGEGPLFEKLRKDHPQVNFRFSLAEGLLNIKGSPFHLEKTLMNIVSNAAESIAGTGEVVIETEKLYLSEPLKGYEEIKEGDYTVLRMKDTGSGISREDLSRIFDPFYTKKKMGKKSGTGLGLAIVWGTVKDHSGYLDVLSREGEGTTFTLYFPVTRDELTEEVKVLPEEYRGRGERVLVVDDVDEQRQVAMTILTRLGYRVETASSGEEAVARLKTHPMDIVILDMLMAPGIDGLETYRRIREGNPDQKVILVSGFSETERVKEALDLGARAYLKKPHSTEKMGMALRKELERI